MLYREHLALPIIEALWLYPCARQQKLSELFCLLYYVISEEYYAAIWNSANVQKREKQGSEYDGGGAYHPLRGPTHLPIDVDQPVADLITLN